MEITNRVNNGANYLASFILTVDFLVAYFLIELTPWEVLKHQIDTLVVDKTIIKLDYIWVTDSFHDEDFPL